VKQMSFAVAMRHKERIVSLAANAFLEGRSSALAVEYDEQLRCLCCVIGLHRVCAAVGRRRWENESANLGTAFNLASSVDKLHQSTLHTAEAIVNGRTKGKVCAPVPSTLPA